MNTIPNTIRQSDDGCRCSRRITECEERHFGRSQGVGEHKAFPSGW